MLFMTMAFAFLIKNTIIKKRARSIFGMFYMGQSWLSSTFVLAEEEAGSSYWS